MLNNLRVLPVQLVTLDDLQMMLAQQEATNWSQEDTLLQRLSDVGAYDSAGYES